MHLGAAVSQRAHQHVCPREVGVPWFFFHCNLEFAHYAEFQKYVRICHSRIKKKNLSSPIFKFLKFWISYVYFLRKEFSFIGMWPCIPTEKYKMQTLFKLMPVGVTSEQCHQHTTLNFLKILWVDHSKPQSSQSSLVFFYKHFILAFKVQNWRDKHNIQRVHDVQLKLSLPWIFFSIVQLSYKQWLILDAPYK